MSRFLQAESQSSRRRSHADAFDAPSWCWEDAQLRSAGNVPIAAMRTTHSEMREPASEACRADSITPWQEHSNDELMSFFQNAREALATMRQSFVMNDPEAIRNEAARIERRAAQVGSKAVGLKALGLKNRTSTGVSQWHMDALEQQLDASEAIYRSSGLRV
jgi:hypothetical protein